jgi:hypothetical protein
MPWATERAAQSPWVGADRHFWGDREPRSVQHAGGFATEIRVMLFRYRKCLLCQLKRTNIAKRFCLRPKEIDGFSEMRMILGL